MLRSHWEGDLLRGAGSSHVITLIERQSRFVKLAKVSGKDTATVVATLSQQVRQLPAALRRSLTWDRGLEMAQHKSFTMATDVQVYFCDPQSPWQRGCRYVAFGRRGSWPQCSSAAVAAAKTRLWEAEATQLP